MRDRLCTRLALMASAALVAATTACGGSAGNHTTVVPNVVGLSLSKAWTVLYRHGVCVRQETMEINGRTNNPNAIVRVVGQHPEAGARVVIPGSASLITEAPLEVGTRVKVSGALVSTSGSGIDCGAPTLKLLK